MIKNNEPINFVIFGGTGDLAHSKLIPSLLDLYALKELPDQFKIIGFSRKDLSDSDYRKFALNSIKHKNHNHDDNLINEFLKKIHYIQGDLNKSEDYDSLNKFLSSIDSERGICSKKLLYIAVPPNLYDICFDNMSSSDLIKKCDSEGQWIRILVEKPFGSNLEEAYKLEKKLSKSFNEDQIYRIDHYLAKDVIQNIISFRFANSIFEPVWNKDFIEKVDIVLYEKEDVSGRSNFYDGIGALRDVGQNHLLNMMAAIIMDDPKSKNADSIRKKRYEALSNVFSTSEKNNEYMVRGQYENYLSHDGVKTDSQIETFFKITLFTKDDRFKNIPFNLISGKSLNQDLVEIKITFKEKESFVCHIDNICQYKNTLKFNIKPDRKIIISFWTKKPRTDYELVEQDLSFNFSSGSDAIPEMDAYEKIFLDAINGDMTLFASSEEVATAWRIILQTLSSWHNLPLIKYKIGSDPSDIINKNN